MNSSTLEKTRLEAEKKIIKEVVQEDIFAFIKKEYPVSGKITLDIRPLWGRCYRLNFWEKRGIGDSNIIKSYFIEVNTSSDGFKIRNYDRDVIKNN